MRVERETILDLGCLGEREALVVADVSPITDYDGKKKYEVDIRKVELLICHCGTQTDVSHWLSPRMVEEITDEMIDLYINTKRIVSRYSCDISMKVRAVA